MRRSILRVGILAAFNVYCLKLYWNGDLLSYIHPRYLAFTGVMNAISLIICVLAIIHFFKSNHTEVGKKAGVLSTILGVPTVILLILGLTLPPKPLERTNVASKSLTELVSQSNGQRLNFVTINPEGEKSIGAWIGELSGPVDEKQVSTQPADVIGFVHAGTTYHPNEFVLSRLVIYCCAVDASPIGLSVHKDDWYEHYKVGTWVRVKGLFKNFGSASAPNYVLVPQSIETIPQPEQPYLYYNF